MKRTITLLLLMLVSQLSMGQVSGTQEAPFLSSKIHLRSQLQKYRAEAKSQQNPQRRSTLATVNKSSTLVGTTLDSLIISSWDNELDAWENGVKEEFSYDANTMVSESLFYIWNENTMAWQVFQKEEYSFDSNGYLVELMRYFQFFPGTWNPTEKVEFAYDVNGNEILETSYAWNIQTSVWVPTYKYETTYDGNQNISLTVAFEWFPGLDQWQNSFKDEYFYTGGLLSSEVSSNWNFGTSAWDLSGRWLYTYSMGQLQTEIQQTWDLGTSLWRNESKFDYAFNAMMFLSSEIASIWDIDTSTWALLYKDEYTYGANNNIAGGIYYGWDDMTNMWVPDTKDEFVYDLGFTFAELTLPYYYGDDFDENIFSINNMLIGYLSYSFDTGIWEVDDRVLFFYSDYSNPLDVSTFAMDASLRVYPNPTSDFVAIDTDIAIDMVEFYSVLGHKVKTVDRDFNAMPVSDMANGLYLMVIKAEGKTVSKRLIKR